MNLTKLFKTQRELDKCIAENMNIDKGSLVKAKIMALRVELFELLNELPEEFKFWSNKNNNMENALKETVDIFHFLLSIGNELGMSERIKIWKMYGLMKRSSISEMIGAMDEYAIELENRYTFYEKSGKQYFKMGDYYNLFNGFFALVEMLGFTWEQIEQAYFKKNKINHQRQESGY